jgi:hypothetical protein
VVIIVVIDPVIDSGTILILNTFSEAAERVIPISSLFILNLNGTKFNPGLLHENQLEQTQLSTWCIYHNSDIIHRPVYLKQDDSETGFCLRLKVELTQLDPTDRVSLTGHQLWVQALSIVTN